MKAGEHLVNLLREVGFDIHASGEITRGALKNNDRDIGSRFDFEKRLTQLQRHREVDDVKRRIGQRDVRDRRADLNVEPSCGGGGQLYSCPLLEPC